MSQEFGEDYEELISAHRTDGGLMSQDIIATLTGIIWGHFRTHELNSKTLQYSCCRDAGSLSPSNVGAAFFLRRKSFPRFLP